jgi:formylglycine-generating enzyme required for sulfatase activity
MNIRALSAALAASAMLASCVLSFDTILPGESASGGDTDVVGGTDDGVDPGDVVDVGPDAGGNAVADNNSDGGVAPTVVVSEPAAETYTLGETLDIVWSTARADDVTLSLLTGSACSDSDTGVAVPLVATLAASTTTYVWDIPTTLAPGEYRMRVRASALALISAVACSPVFSLQQPAGCASLGCASQNRTCTVDSGAAACGDCVDGFAETDGVCVVVDCDTAPAAPANATLSSVSSTRFGGVATYTCVEGFTTTGQADGPNEVTRRCGAAATWEIASVACTPVDCGANPAPGANTVLQGVDRTTYGGQASYSCATDYVVTATGLSSYTLTCSASGSWGTAPACEPVNCGALTNPANGTVSTPGGITVGATATYNCNSGYTLSSGSTTRTCSASGTWSGSAGVCTPVDCGTPLVAPANSVLTGISSTRFGGVATYTCGEGFTANGRVGGANQITQRCNSTATWGNPTGVCTPVNCGALTNPTNGTVSTPGGNTLGATATYSCSSGYTLSSGSTTRTCQSSGTWSGSSGVCTAVDCGTPPTVTNGTRTFTTTTSGSTASYACNSGYTRSGSATLTCGATGSWGTALTCADTNECVPAGSVCTGANNVCTNTEGSWQCSCAEGYTGTTVTGGNATCVLGGGSGTLGAACTADSECPANSWCSTVSGYRRCSPRVFSGAAHQMDFLFVPAGTFQQGTPGATNEERPYTATISRNYFVSRTEVTQGQWKAATGGTNGSCFQNTSGTSCTTSNANNNGPVEQVDWYSTLAYANWLSVNQGLSACYTLSGCTNATSGWHDGVHSGCTGATFTGLTCTGYRLLTESEWEHAARGGTTSTYYWGTATDTATVGLYAWYSGNAGNRTQAVGGKQANAYGLHDMSGNVWEWVWDWVYTSSAWIPYPSGSATDYIGPSSGSNRGFRGGSWYYDTSLLRSADRDKYGPSYRDHDIGFRLARTAN